MNVSLTKIVTFDFVLRQIVLNSVLHLKVFQDSDLWIFTSNLSIAVSSSQIINVL